MSYWVYSPESIPSLHLANKARYTPEQVMFGGIAFQFEEGKWTKYGEVFYTLRHKDWRDRTGTRDPVHAEDAFKRIGAQFANRGVTILDHEPTKEERSRLEKEAHDTNRAYRMSVVTSYENAMREREITGHGRSAIPTPYEDECYTILELQKPYSVEAMRAQRHPGEAVAREFRDAMLEVLAERKAREAEPKAETKVK